MSPPDFDVSWATLTHAYGTAADIPGLLDALAACDPLPSSWREAPLSSLAEALCHQTSTFDASYAAFPRLVEIAAGRPSAQRAATLHLIGSIAAYQSLGAPVPVALLAPYEAARTRAADVALDALRELRARHVRHELLAIADLAACRGHDRLARAVMATESEEFDVRCDCGARHTLGATADGVDVAPLVWAARPSADDESTRTHGLASLAATLGLRATMVLADLGGAIVCPECRGSIPLIEGVESAAGRAMSSGRAER